MTYQAGQEVWVVFHGRLSGYTNGSLQKLTKVGTKWAYFGRGRERFDIDNGRIDGAGYESPGRVFASEEACLQIVKDEQERHDLRVRMLKSNLRDIPASVTTEELRAFVEKCGW